MVLNNRHLFRFAIAALVTVLSCAAFLAPQKSANAESAALINPKKTTHDLDQKDESLAEEEAALIESITRGKKKESAAALPVKKSSTSDSSRASIDLKRVAETIVSTDSPPKTKIETLTGQKEITNPAHGEMGQKPTLQKAAIEKPEMTREVRTETQPEPAVQEVVRVVSESDPALKKEVAAMGDMFNQWHREFEQKYASVLDTQSEMSRALNARIDVVEKRKPLESGTGIGEEELDSVRTDLIKKQEAIEARVIALEKKKTAAPAAGSSAATEQALKKIAQQYGEVQAALTAQDQSIKSLRLIDGQVKFRVNEVEANVTSANNEIASVKQAVTRIESNLNELSDQFVDSLKYRPHQVYQAPTEWSGYEYNWNAPGPRYSGIPHNAVMSDMPMVTVTEEVANLWSGPEEDDKIVTTIRRGAQLAVEASEQDWYRVIVADGRRAWIPSRSVIHNNPVGKDTTLRIASAD